MVDCNCPDVVKKKKQKEQKERRVNQMTNWLPLLIKYLPTVLNGVVAVQSAIKAPGQTKKQILLNAITAGASTAEQIPESHIAAIGTMIDVAVSSLKAAGLHGFSNVPATVATAPPVATGAGSVLIDSSIATQAFPGIQIVNPSRE